MTTMLECLTKSLKDQMWITYIILLANVSTGCDVLTDFWVLQQSLYQPVN